METIIAINFTGNAKDEHKMNFGDPVEWLKSQYHTGYNGCLDNLKSIGMHKLLGWAYDFRPYLKQYLVLQYGHWQSYYAPNKTLLRNTLYGKIDNIIELTNK